MNPRGGQKLDCKKYYEILVMQESKGISELRDKAFLEHAKSCPACASLGREFQQIDQGLRSLADVSAPIDFTEQLLKKLPKRKKPILWLPRMRVVGATAALVLLLGSPLYLLTENPKPYVESSDARAQVQIVDATVHVPAGTVVRGDLRVYNAELRVAGRVEGTVYLVSSGLSVEQDGQVVGSVKMLPQSWMERLRFGILQVSQEVRSYVKGAWR